MRIGKNHLNHQQELFNKKNIKIMKKIFSLALLIVTFIACGGPAMDRIPCKYELEFNVYLPDNTVDKKTMIIDGDQYTNCEVKTHSGSEGRIYEYYIKDNSTYNTIYEGPFPIYITKLERM